MDINELLKGKRHKLPKSTKKVLRKMITKQRIIKSLVAKIGGVDKLKQISAPKKLK